MRILFRTAKDEVFQSMRQTLVVDACGRDQNGGRTQWTWQVNKDDSESGMNVLEHFEERRLGGQLDFLLGLERKQGMNGGHC